MKKIHVLILAAALALLLCACGGSTVPAEATASPTEAPASVSTPAPVEESAVQSVLPDAGLHEAEDETEDPEIAQRRAIAQELVGKSTEELIAALGEPLERNYGPSCLGSGEDGELVYEGFTVFTYRDGDKETISDVE